MEEDMMDTQLQNKLTWLYKYCRYYEADCEHKNDCLLIDDCPHQKEVMAGDYDNLLRVSMEYVEVV